MRRTFRFALALVAIAAGGCERDAPSTQSTHDEPRATVATTAPAPDIGEHSPPPQEPPVPASSVACLAKTAEQASRRPSAIHRWVDGAGITHYSDQAPTAPVSAHRVIDVAGVAPVTVKASGYDVNLPSGVEQRAIADALAVQRVFRDVLGIAAPPTTELRIVFVRDAAAYGRLIGDSALSASSGAYVPPQHTIYVRLQGDDELAFSVLRHEITHALVHEAVGNLPVALGEGLAEYFRRYRVAGMGGEIDLGADREPLAGAAPAGDGSDALVELLALSGLDFYAADRERRYLEAYALIAVLMHGPEPVAALHDVLARQRDAPCEPIAAETVLEARYPGGLRALAADWAAFMRDAPASVRSY